MHKQFSSSPQQHSRSKRRLPHVLRPGRSRPLTFWPTYKGAVEWLRRHHATLDTALGLLEIYPALIQEPAMDIMWEFLSPFLALSRVSRASTSGMRRPRRKDHHSAGSFHTSKNSQTKLRTTPQPAARQRTMTSTTSSLPANLKGPVPTPWEPEDSCSSQDSHDQLPLISITCSQPDHPEPELQALFDEAEDTPQSNGPPCVYVCCPCSHRSAGQGHRDTLYQHVLHALHHDFYVRAGPCRSVENALDCEVDDLTESDAYVFVVGDDSLYTPACLKRLYALWSLNIPSVFVKDSNYCLPSPLPDAIQQYIHTLESSEMPLVASSAHLPIPRSTTPRCGLSIPAASTSSATPGSKQRRQHESEQDGLEESDFMLFLLNGYRTALIFEETSFDGCESMLKEKVQFISGREMSQDGSGASYNLTLHAFSSEPFSAQIGGQQAGQLRMTSSEMDRSQGKDAEAYGRCGNEDGKSLSLDHLRSTSDDLPADMPSMSDNNNSVSASSYSAVDNNGNASTRLRSPLTSKIAAGISALSAMAKPPLPPVKSPSKSPFLSPFSHLPHLLKQQQLERAPFPAEHQAVHGSEGVEKADDR